MFSEDILLPDINCLDKNKGLLSTSSVNNNQKKSFNNSPRVSTVSSMSFPLSCINRCNVLSLVPVARFIEQSLPVTKNKILMSSSDTHVFVDNVQECSYDEFSNDHVVISNHDFAFYNCKHFLFKCNFFLCLLLHLIITNKMRFLIYMILKNTKGIKICSHNVNRMESKFDETKNNLLQSKHPPDIIGFNFFFMMFDVVLFGYRVLCMMLYCREIVCFV